MDNYKEIRGLIEEGKLNEAAKKLKNVAESVGDVKSRDMASILLSRISNLEDKRRKGIIEHDKQNIEQNSISNDILIETNDLEERESAKSFKVKKNDEQVTIQFSEDRILELTITAGIIIELEKIKAKYNKQRNWKKNGKVLRKLFKFSDHTTPRIANAVFAFLSMVSSDTRSGMDSEIAYSIESLIIHYFPKFEKGKEDNEFNNLAFQCIHIGDNLFYDAAIYLRDRKVAVEGLQILKWIYWRAKERDISEVMDKVKETYKELESTLNRPERNDLGIDKELLQIFRSDLDNRGLHIPAMPINILELI